MDAALNIGLILFYSIFGAGSAVLAKIAINRGMHGHWFGASTAFAVALGAFGLAMLSLFLVLHRAPVGLVAPIAAGFNLLLTSLAARTFFHETISNKAIAGNGFIVAGIAILSVTS
jgi:multidrug transporter EmrE-like cation transporter